MNRSRSIRPRSLRPRRTQAIQDLQRLVRNLGAPPPEVMNAVRETAGDASDRPAIAEEGIQDLADHAAEVCLAAYRVWEDCSAPVRAHLRGFSLDLLAMVAQEVVNLDRSFRDYQQCGRDIEEAAQRAGALRERNRALYEQGMAVLQMVGGRDAVPATVGAEPLRTSSLEALAVIARQLTQSENPVVRSRCQLYHLDGGYVQALLTAANELSGAEQRAENKEILTQKRADLDRLLDMLCPLLHYISQVFELARRFEPNIPKIPHFELPKSAAVKITNTAAATKTRLATVPREVVKPAETVKVTEPRRVQKLTFAQDVNARPKGR